MIRPSNQARTHNIRDFIGGSDARIIMRQDEKALIRLWQVKRGEVGSEDLLANLIVQLGVATEDLGVGRRCGGRERGSPQILSGFGVLPFGFGFPKANTSTASVFVDEFDSGSLDCFPQSHSNLVGHFRAEASL
jgi:hypothetical protein